MSPSEPSFHLWIATDDTRTVAALAPLKVSRAPLKHEWGSITDLRAMPSAQGSPNFASLIVLVSVVVIGAFGLCLTGAPLLVIFILTVLLLGVGLAATLSKAPPAQVVAPDLAAFPELHHTLDKAEEREEFLDLVELAERAGRALPSIESLVDPAEGGQLLAQTLWEAADVLSRRQQLRLQVARRQHERMPAPAANSQAARSLAEQREKSGALWEQNSAELSRIQTAFELAAVAAENAAQDPSAVDAAREAYRELADICGEGF